jgi:hypothetical protein
MNQNCIRSETSSLGPHQNQMLLKIIEQFQKWKIRKDTASSLCVHFMHFVQKKIIKFNEVASK